MDSSKTTPRRIQQAARELGKRSWQARLKRYGIRKLKEQQSAAGKAAKHSGRPRLPDDQVKPNTLYQRARRARLKFQAQRKKGGTKHGKSS
jgi:hypothetical protein